MTKYRQVELKEFFDIIETIEYRDQDKKEAFDFGCTDIIDCYRKAKHRWAKYFIVEEDGRAIVTVMLQRDGNIIFFISRDVRKKVALIKQLRKLANKVTNKCGVIITKTANWYKEAQRLNEVIGFKEWRIYDYYTHWVKE